MDNFNEPVAQNLGQNYLTQKHHALQHPPQTRKLLFASWNYDKSCLKLIFGLLHLNYFRRLRKLPNFGGGAEGQRWGSADID